MNHSIPCITDSDEHRFPEEQPEPESPLTDVEKHINWICDSWHGALEIDTAEEWQSVRSELFGAKQAFIHSARRWDQYKALHELSSIAFENTIACIRAGRYEGAK